LPYWKKILYSFLLAANAFSVNAQDLLATEKNWGFNAGLNLAFGTHIRRLGVNLNFFFVSNFFQANSEVRAYYSFKNLGPHLKTPELVLSQGVVFGYGDRNFFFNPFISSVSNQTNYKNSFAYSYNAYINTINTEQQTGIIVFQVHEYSLLAENDILARPALDRFRTGAFMLQYQYLDMFQAGINGTLWTGKMGYKAGIINPKFHYQCYMDTTKSEYPNYSHGLLSAQLKYHVGYSQTVQLNAGIDAEQIRNAIQNEFIHDMVFIPKKWNKARNCHIPMLDKNGNQYLYKDGQEIREPKAYLNFFTNAGVFY
jgi:hypothetical protein